MDFNEWFNSPADWASVIAIVSSLIVGVRWLARQQTKKMEEIAKRLDERTEIIQSGARNGGHSLTDISERMTRFYKENDAYHAVLSMKVDKALASLNEHLAFHDRRVADSGPPDGVERRRGIPG